MPSSTDEISWFAKWRKENKEALLDNPIQTGSLMSKEASSTPKENAVDRFRLKRKVPAAYQTYRVDPNDGNGYNLQAYVKEYGGGKRKDAVAYKEFQKLQKVTPDNFCSCCDELNPSICCDKCSTWVCEKCFKSEEDICKNCE